MYQRWAEIQEMKQLISQASDRILDPEALNELQPYWQDSKITLRTNTGVEKAITHKELNKCRAVIRVNYRRQDLGEGEYSWDPTCPLGSGDLGMALCVLNRVNTEEGEFPEFINIVGLVLKFCLNPSNYDRSWQARVNQIGTDSEASEAVRAICTFHCDVSKRYHILDDIRIKIEELTGSESRSLFPKTSKMLDLSEKFLDRELYPRFSLNWTDFEVSLVDVAKWRALADDRKPRNHQEAKDFEIIRVMSHNDVKSNAGEITFLSHRWLGTNSDPSGYVAEEMARIDKQYVWVDFLCIDLHAFNANRLAAIVINFRRSQASLKRVEHHRLEIAESFWCVMETMGLDNEGFSRISFHKLKHLSKIRDIQVFLILLRQCECSVWRRVHLLQAIRTYLHEEETYMYRMFGLLLVITSAIILYVRGKATLLSRLVWTLRRKALYGVTS
jgi:hypothetical protein